MGKGKYLRLVLTIAFIFGFTLLQIILWSYLRNSQYSAWTQRVDIVLSLVFWLFLWKLSSSGYEGHRGVGRWVRPSGLLKAFLVLIISLGLGSWAYWNYVQIAARPYFEMGDVLFAVERFYDDYKVYPGSAGPMTPAVYDELTGSANAKINTTHHDYLAGAKVKSIQDGWGHPYWIRIDPANPAFPDSPNVVIISCGPNGIFENGQGDDLSFPRVKRD